MKTKLQNLFMAALTLAASTQKLGVNLIRVAILVIFVWIGGPQPWTPAMLLKYLCSLTKATYLTLIPVPANTFPAHNLTERQL